MSIQYKKEKKGILKGMVDYILLLFGYNSIEEFYNSLFTLITKFSIGLCLIAAGVGGFIEDYVGLEPKVYMFLVALFILEFFTGVAASVWKRKEKFSSSKLGRIILKIIIYTTVLTISNVFRNHIGDVDIFNLDFNFFEWIYFIILNLLILQLFISVLENLESLGFKEVSPILRLFHKKKQEILKDNQNADDKK